MVAIAHTYDVFISYSHKDQAWVDSQLMPRLEGAGLHVAIDYRDFPLGRIAQQNMEQAVDSSRRVVLVMSPNWLQSQWSGFEYLLRQCGGSDRAAGETRSHPDRANRVTASLLVHNLRGPHQPGDLRA